MNLVYKKHFIKQFEKYDRRLQRQIDNAIIGLPVGDIVV